jgi:hypothetical protein
LHAWRSVARKLKAIDVIDVLSDLFILRGIPGHIRSDNGPEFVAEASIAINGRIEPPPGVVAENVGGCPGRPEALSDRKARKIEVCQAH